MANQSSRSLERYSSGRVLLAGDAVCIHISYTDIIHCSSRRRRTECLRIKERVLAKRSRSVYNSESYEDVSNYNYHWIGRVYF